jgi:tRNA C32,U32 (ribose-2'-O)-methylase TrmJ
VVSPECPGDWKTSEQVQAFATGSSNENLVDFREASNLQEALATCTRALAFTRRPRERYPLDVLFSEALLLPGVKKTEPFHVEWPEGSEKVALVFGNEKTGLTDDEIQECQQCVRIATSQRLGSMNLSHAAATVLSRLFEWAELDSTKKTAKPTPEYSAREAPATLEELQAMWAHWEVALNTLGFNQAGNPQRILASLQELLSPLHFKHHQVQLLRGILHRIQKAPIERPR